MCALCGVLGNAEHWADAHARDGVFTRNTTPVERRRERGRRVAAANIVLAHFGLTVKDWQGRAFLLATRTGRSEIVDSLSHLWAAADRLRGQACDPLDPGLLARLERAGRRLPDV